ncbi:MAG TPA: hypothetical protein VFH60_00190 [Chloroflexia bacterium]|nr:hypothetical protein [Chloroflexia bacterium]
MVVVAPIAAEGVRGTTVPATVARGVAVPAAVLLEGVALLGLCLREAGPQPPATKTRDAHRTITQGCFLMMLLRMEGRRGYE